jgi:hypothetical protein
MKHMRRLFGIIIALLIPLGVSAPVFAETQSVSVEITVTAVVPSHRDIIVDKNGAILEIDSNTKEDVMPDVYLNKVAPENKQTLSPEMYAEYRQHVPEGTAKYGVLYKPSPISTLLSATKKPLYVPLFGSVLTGQTKING